MNTYRQFVYKDYSFDREAKTLSLVYGYDDELEFHEKYMFDFEFAEYDGKVLDRVCQLLFFVAGISYYKAFLAPEIAVRTGSIDGALADFLSKTYRRGLGEFFYVNRLDPRIDIVFPVNSESLPELSGRAGESRTVGIGGGKDSLLSVELLRNTGLDFTTWSLNHRSQLEPLINRVGGKHFWVERDWDKQLLSFKDDPEAYDGHVPISAVFACVGTIVCVLTGQRDAVVSNESSASEPTLHYDGVAINHQYSKSLEFEKDYQELLRRNFGDRFAYYSLLRPLSELRISELFAQSGFEKYKSVFSSCNRAFTHDSDRLFWDGRCPKCAFVFLAFTPFVERGELEHLFDGKNLLLDPELEPTYRQLLGIEGDKPLECVGEIKESRAAMKLAQKAYPKLDKYDFELPADYDYRALSEHTMPAELFDRLKDHFSV